MKVYWKMPKDLKKVFTEELRESNVFFKENNWLASWQKLERAHIIGQPWAIEHSQAHWEMLVFAVRIKNIKEIIGQIPRLFVGGIKSYIGEIPTGNTGGANVHPLKKMPIPEDIIQMMKPYI
jgi:hypothetical protein